MYLSDLANRGNIPVLEKVMAFAEARHVVIANNIANIDNPDYLAKQLNPEMFQQTLRRAVNERSGDTGKGLEIATNDEVRLDESGQLIVTPQEKPVNNILFHDGTNASIETEMTNLAQNSLAYKMASQLLQNSFSGLEKAIRGRV